jgi:hypothetical protein
VATGELAVEDGRVAAERDRRLRDEGARAGLDLAPEGLPLAAARVRADEQPVAAALVDRLDDELVQVLEDVAPRYAR